MKIKVKKMTVKDFAIKITAVLKKAGKLASSFLSILAARPLVLLLTYTALVLTFFTPDTFLLSSKEGICDALQANKIKSDTAGISFAEKKYGSLFTCRLEKCASGSLNLNQSKFDFDTAKVNPIIIAFFDTRLEDYQEDKTKISEFLNSLGVFLIFGTLLLYYNPSTVTLPFLSTPIPQDLISCVIIIGLTYYWANFSLILMSTVDSRMVLEFAIDHLEKNINTPINHYYSKSRILLDQGFIDPWCTYYHDVFKNGYNHDNHHLTAAYFLFGIYAPFFGAAIGTSVTMSLNLFRRKSNIIFFYGTFLIFWTLWTTSMGIVGLFEHSAGFIGSVWVFAYLYILIWLIWTKVGIHKN